MGAGAPDVSAAPARVSFRGRCTLAATATGGKAEPAGRRIIPGRIGNFAMAMRRLTRVHVRSVEQPVNPDDGEDIFNWPWMVVGEMGDWKLTESQALKVREYLLRGGFLMMDDFWGAREWNRFMDSMSLIFPDRPIVEIEDADADFSHRVRPERAVSDSRPVGAAGRNHLSGFVSGAGDGVGTALAGRVRR